MNLLPKQFPRTRRIGIVERTHVTRIYPIAYTIFDSLSIHPPISVEFVKMLGFQIKFRPHRNHNVRMLIVHFVNHALGIGKTRRIKFMTAPLVFFPIKPILNNIIDRNAALSEFRERFQQLILRFVPFAALPKTHCPFWHDLRFSRKFTVIGNHTIHIVARHKIIIDLISHLGIKRDIFLHIRINRRKRFQSDIRHASVGNPLQLEVVFFTGLHIDLKFGYRRIPCRPPSIGHQLIIDPNFRITGIVEKKTINTVFERFEIALPRNFGIIEIHPIREIFNRFKIFIIDRAFVSHDKYVIGYAIIDVSSRQSTLLAIGIVKFKLAYLPIRTWIAITRQGIIIPQ